MKQHFTFSQNRIKTVKPCQQLYSDIFVAHTFIHTSHTSLPSILPPPTPHTHSSPTHTHTRVTAYVGVQILLVHWS